MKPILEVKNLNYIYSVGTPFEHKALGDVSFQVNRGEFIGVIGHTGSGKSTLMQQLNGLLKPTSGKVLLDGEDIWADKKKTRQARFRVGLVFQYPEYQLFEETVYKDIAFGPKNMGLDDAEIDRRVREAAGFVGLTEAQLEVSPFDLSGGQKRRVAIAGVIAMEPKCIVLDEPTAMLDPKGRREVLDTVIRLNREKKITVVLITHHMDEAAKADRVVVLHGGEVALDGEPKSVFSQVDKLHEIGLRAPETTELCWALNQQGCHLDITCLDENECAQTLYDAFSAK